MNVLQSLVEKMPWQYWAVMIPVLIVTCLYTAQHIRRDKQGKVYWFSQKYEDKKRTDQMYAIQQKLDNHIISDKGLHNTIDSRLIKITLTNLKQSFYMQGMPEVERMFSGLQYIAEGGNHEVKDDVLKFVKQHPDMYHNIVRRHQGLHLVGEEI